ncbi:hypothetical protein FB446DRAFT_353606 [Lentinula raphanica]|nr:hypothetical protein FB446DRAFT_353606 [Lentinula raphanica]
MSPGTTSTKTSFIQDLLPIPTPAESLAYVQMNWDTKYLDHFANLITKLSKKLQVRERVVAGTATAMFFHRFYFTCFSCGTDPYLPSARCYVTRRQKKLHFTPRSSFI